jgi:HD-GYP domain-containing protein (c-di-GMP phosphodiesterase class II)
VLDVCLHHHEKKWTVQDTLHCLSGDKGQHIRKMGAVCDVYDAITSILQIRAWDPAESLRKMAE